MASEYVKLDSEEKKEGARDLLQSRLKIIKLISHYRSYKQLRKEELIYKIALKTKIDETKNFLKVFDSLLPKTSFKEPKSQFNVELKSSKKKQKSLEQEIDEIRRKLDSLK